jgi:Tfp pilus assembly protein PilO
MGSESHREDHGRTHPAVFILVVAAALLLALMFKQMRANQVREAEAQARLQAEMASRPQVVSACMQIDELRRENDALKHKIQELEKQLPKAPEDAPAAEPAQPTSP